MNLQINVYFLFSAQQQYEQQLGMFTQFCRFELWCWENKSLEYKYAYYIYILCAYIISSSKSGIILNMKLKVKI